MDKNDKAEKVEDFCDVVRRISKEVLENGFETGVVSVQRVFGWFGELLDVHFRDMESERVRMQSALSKLSKAINSCR